MPHYNLAEPTVKTGGGLRCSCPRRPARVSEGYLPLADIMPGALDKIEVIGSRGALGGGPAGSPVLTRRADEPHELPTEIGGEPVHQRRGRD